MADFSCNKFVNFLIQQTVLKTNSNGFKKNNDFGYILQHSCFTEQLSMPASEVLIDATREIFGFAKPNKNTKIEHARINRKKIEKVRKRMSNTYIVVFAFLL